MYQQGPPAGGQAAKERTLERAMLDLPLPALLNHHTGLHIVTASQHAQPLWRQQPAECWPRRPNHQRTFLPMSGKKRLRAEPAEQSRVMMLFVHIQIISSRITFETRQAHARRIACTRRQACVTATTKVARTMASVPTVPAELLLQ